MASRSCGDGERWERKTRISGPLLTLWIDAACGGGRGAYIELMGHPGQTRTLCVKCWTDHDDLTEVREHVADRIGDAPGRRLRRLRQDVKSCTAWADALIGKSPEDAAMRCDELAERLVGCW